MVARVSFGGQANLHELSIFPSAPLSWNAECCKNVILEHPRAGEIQSDC